jgi:hypothetical protein
MSTKLNITGGFAVSWMVAAQLKALDVEARAKKLRIKTKSVTGKKYDKRGLFATGCFCSFNPNRG